MKCKVPTIAKFNSWTTAKKLWWIDYETYGKYKDMGVAKGYFPMMLYNKENVGIVYKVDSKGKLIEAIAMTLLETMDRLKTFEHAVTATMSKSRQN